MRLNRDWRFLLSIALIAATLLLCIWGAAALSDASHFPENSSRASILQAVLAGIALVLSLISLLRPSPYRPATATRQTELIEVAATALVSQSLAQWRGEVAIRQLEDPAPMAVRWHLSERPIMDRIPQLTRDRGLGDLAGRMDRVRDLAEIFRTLEWQRLVIVGEPGTGKTTLATLLVRELLEHYEQGEQVPVYLSVADWSEGERLDVWMERKLEKAFSGIGNDSHQSLAGKLIRERRILPILDGLDELSPTVRPVVLRELNNALTQNDSLILTCRTEEFLSAVGAPSGDVLTRTPVIELEPLGPASSSTYLRNCLSPQASPAWTEVLAAIERGAILSEAVSAPLVLWLLRRIYVDTGADPSELITSKNLDTRDLIVRHLFDRSVASVFTARPPDRHAIGGTRPKRRWDAEQAEQWLGYIACHANQTFGEFAWWTLYYSIRRTVFINLARVVLFFGGLALIWVFPSSEAGVIGAITTSAVMSIIVSMLIFFQSPEPPTTFGVGRIGRRVMAHPVLSVAAAIVVVSIVSLSSPSVRESGLFLVGRVVLVVAGLIFAVSIALNLAHLATPPSTEVNTLSPTDSLRKDRVASLAKMAIAGSGFGAAAYVICVLALGWGDKGALTLGSVTALNFALWRGMRTASGAYALSVGILVVKKGILPPRFSQFIADAHVLGLLRQAGPYYQFRHSLLKDHLAEKYNEWFIARGLLAKQE